MKIQYVVGIILFSLAVYAAWEGGVFMSDEEKAKKLFDIAAAYESSGETEKALSAYKKLISRYGNASVTKTAQQNTEQLEAALRYEISDYGYVYDKQTDLTWLRCTLGQKWDGNTCVGNYTGYTWQEAVNFTANIFGYDGWQLPTIDELRSLVYCRNGNPDTFTMAEDNSEDGWGCKGGNTKEGLEVPSIIEHVFPKTGATRYFSKSRKSGNDVWSVYFQSGGDGSHDASYQGLVRLVYKGRIEPNEEQLKSSTWRNAPRPAPFTLEEKLRENQRKAKEFSDSLRTILDDPEQREMLLDMMRNQ
jgi:hypothetical protein